MYIYFYRRPHEKQLPSESPYAVYALLYHPRHKDALFSFKSKLNTRRNHASLWHGGHRRTYTAYSDNERHRGDRVLFFIILKIIADKGIIE